MEFLARTSKSLILVFQQDLRLSRAYGRLKGLFIDGQGKSLSDILDLFFTVDDQPLSVFIQEITDANLGFGPIDTTYLNKEGQTIYVQVSAVRSNSELHLYIQHNETFPLEKAHLGQLLDYAGTNIWSYNDNTGEFTIGKRGRALLQLPAGYKLNSKNIRNLIITEDYPYLAESFMQYRHTEGEAMVINMRTFEGNTLWIRIYHLVSYNEAEMLYGIFQDITEAKEQEMLLRKQKLELEMSHRRLSRAEKVTRLGHWTFYKADKTYQLSTEAHDICGIKKDKVLSPHEFEPFINPEGMHFREGAEPVPGIYKHKIRTHKEKWVIITVDSRFQDSESTFGTIQDVTEEVKYTQRALNNEAKQVAILNSIPSPICLTDTNGLIRQANLAFSNLVDKKEHRCIGKCLYDLMDFRQPKSFKATDQKILNGEIRSNNIPVEIFINGEPQEVNLYRKPFYNSSGNIMGLIVLIKENASEIKANAKLSLANKQLSLAISGLNAGFFIYDVQKDINYWDAKSSEIFGYPAEPYVGEIKDFLSLVHEDDREKLQMQKESDYHHRETFEVRYRIIINNEVKHIRALGTLEYESGKAKKIVGVHLDISDQIHSEYLLNATQDKYRDLLENASEGYLLLSCTGAVIDANPAAVRLLKHLSKDDLIDTTPALSTEAEPVSVPQLYNALSSDQSWIKKLLVLPTKNDGGLLCQAYLSSVEKGDISYLEITFSPV